MSRLTLSFSLYYTEPKSIKPRGPKSEKRNIFLDLTPPRGPPFCARFYPSYYTLRRAGSKLSTIRQGLIGFIVLVLVRML